MADQYSTRIKELIETDQAKLLPAYNATRHLRAAIVTIQNGKRPTVSLLVSMLEDVQAIEAALPMITDWMHTLHEILPRLSEFT